MATGSSTGNNKQARKASTDVILNLPPNVIQQILECLPLIDAARMSILSRDWRYKWLSLPELTLDLTFNDALRKQRNATLDFSRVYSDAVNKILLRHRGPIHKFVFHVPCHLPKGSDINCWIEFVCGNGVKEFYLDDYRLPKLRVPSCLFSCVSLTRLTLLCGSFSLPATFRGFPYLISLKLHTCEDDHKKLEYLISNCPMLEGLDLMFDELTCLTIRAPKLEDLVLRGTVTSLCLEKTARIKKLELDIGGYQGSNIEELLICLPNVEKLSLSHTYGCGLEPCKTLAKQLTRLRSLSLEVPLACECALSLVLCLLKNSPNLMELQIKGLKCARCKGNLCQIKEPYSFQNLKYVEVLSISGSATQLKLIKFLLENSPVLRLLTIEFDELAIRGHEAKFNVAKELMRYRRASTNAEIALK